MNHYELVFIVNPQLSKDSKLFDKCKEQITSINGILHRAEDIGLRDLAYQIDDCSKGHYFLLNFVIDVLTHCRRPSKSGLR